MQDTRNRIKKSLESGYIFTQQALSPSLMKNITLILLTLLYLSCATSIANPQKPYLLPRNLTDQHHIFLHKKKFTQLSVHKKILQQSNNLHNKKTPPNLNQNNAIITGTAKNISAHIPNMIENINNIKKVFDKSIVIFLVDQGEDDGTTEHLQEYVRNNDNTKLLIIENPGEKREERLSLARNTLLKESQKLLLAIYF